MLPDEHPDGDPFAAADAAKANNSLIGRLEQRALLESTAPTPSTPSAGFAPPKPRSSTAATSSGKPRSSAAATPASATPLSASTANGTSKSSNGGATVGPGREIVIDDSDSDSEGEAVMTGDEGGAAAAGEGGEGSDDDDEEDGSGTEGDGSEDGGAARAGPQDEDEDDEEDDSDDDDDGDSMASGPTAGKAGAEGDGEGDVSMADSTAGGEARPKSPIKPSSAGANGEAKDDGDVAMADGSPAVEGAEGSEQPAKKPRARRRAPRSPTPPPPAPKPPQPTIRLEFTLPPRDSSRSGEGNYPEFNVIEIARAKGLLPPEEEKNVGENNDESGSEAGGKRDKGKGKADDEGGEPPKKKRKRGPNVIVGRHGGYDTTDDFVDDAEIELYEPRFSARPARDGYFICSGDVEVASRRGRVKGSKNKPKLDDNGKPVPPAPASGRQSKVVTGADGKPVHANAGASTSAAATFGSGAPNGGAPSAPPKPERKKGEFSAELQADLDMLKTEAAKETWAVKNKFPPPLRELLTSVAYHALDLDEYHEDFFAVMPKLFPYNLFTLKKLIKREVFAKRIGDMTKAQDDHLDRLKVAIDEVLPGQRAEFEKRLEEWKEKQRAEEAAGAAGAAGGGGFGGIGAVPRQGTPELGGRPGFGEASPAIGTPMLGAVAGADGANGSPAPGKDDKENAEPKWRFRFNDAMRNALYHACDLEDKKSELIVEKQGLEKSTTREVNPEKEHSTKNARKAMYTRIVQIWPHDLMTSNQVSREISNYKLKLKRLGEIPVDA